MSRFTLTEDDLKAGYVIDPDKAGWFLLEHAGSVEKASSKGDGSIVAHVTFKVIRPLDEGADPAMVGVPVKVFYSEKALGMSLPMWKAFGKEIKAGDDINFNEPKGMTVAGYIKREKHYQGNGYVNSIVDFRPASE